MHAAALNIELLIHLIIPLAVLIFEAVMFMYHEFHNPDVLSMQCILIALN